MTRLALLIPSSRRSRGSPSQAAQKMHPVGVRSPMYAMRQGAHSTSMPARDTTRPESNKSGHLLLGAASPRPARPERAERASNQEGAAHSARGDGGPGAAEARSARLRRAR